jgi:hypothetical protein
MASKDPKMSKLGAASNWEAYNINDSSETWNNCEARKLPDISEPAGEGDIVWLVVQPKYWN